ncbi:P-loop ATPase, Sll1717 family [Sinorhizobium fredii]|uniref:P-loop ATPase, Sll1717 family n=1 Tax=Rhizobium fredii TaxID=380 RepID=UPI00351685F8
MIIAARKTAFVAYSSGDSTLADLIFEAVRRANSKPLPFQYEPWPFNDVPGTPLISPILEKIDESPFVVGDITYLNLNVIYEVGFAIGRGKRVFLIRHKQTAGDKALANSAGIFDTLGYHEYSGVEDLQARLSAYIDETPLPISFPLNRKALVYILEPPVRSQAVKILISRVKKAGYHHYRSFNPDEDLRLSATDAVHQVAESCGVVMPLQDTTVDGADVHNIRAMFVAGLADGMGKPRLIIAPPTCTVPLDVRDTVRSYRREEDIIDAVAGFCPAIVEYGSQAEPAGAEIPTKLQALNVGDPRAENEMTTLNRYYLRTHEYDRALGGEVNLVVGRKGSGKTALWISVRDKTRADKRNIVVDLKPEGYQLIKLKEDILEHLTEGAREHLITAFWEYLILLEVAYKLLEKDQNTYRHNHNLNQLYTDLEAVYRAPDFSAEGDFAERLSNLSQRLINEYKARFDGHDGQRLSAAQVTQLLYTHDLRDLRLKVSEYLEFKESVWVLFDNLDRGWNTRGLDAIDAIVLRCLVDAGRRLEREMRRDGHKFHCIVFVRNDVYDHLVKHSTDYGKELRATLDWSDPDMLREMFRLRLISALDGAEEVEFDRIWRQICVPHYQGEETSSYMIERSLMRPRNLLKIFSHCRGFATNFRHERIEEADIEKGMKAYSEDLLQELDRELSDVHPEANDLLYYFLDARSTLSPTELEVILTAAGISADQQGEVIDFLLYYGVLGIRSGGGDYFIYAVNYDLKILKIRAGRDKSAQYVINPAFWPALSIVQNASPLLDASQVPAISSAISATER